MTLMSSRRGAAESLALPLMVLSFIMIGGFLYWLSVTAEPTAVAIVEDTPGGEGMTEGTAVAWTAFGADPGSFEGQTIILRGVPIASRLGEGAFWSQLPNETPYLVKLSGELIAEGTVVASGETGDLTGTVYAMTDSVLNAWQEAGVFTDDVQRIEAEFATSFLEASSFQVQVPEGG